eukprot:8998384-Pyramimonas_sp.AAC.1
MPSAANVADVIAELAALRGNAGAAESRQEFADNRGCANERRDATPAWMFCCGGAGLRGLERSFWKASDVYCASQQEQLV